MVWLELDLKRPGIELQIEGRYNPPPSHKDLIEIIMVIEGEERLIYSHNPTSLCHEEPTSDEVALKYHGKVRKIVKKATSAPLDQLRAWKASQ